MRYITCGVWLFLFVVTSLKPALANEEIKPMFDASIVLINSTNTAGAGSRVQYSAVLKNTGTEIINKLRVRLYSPNATTEPIWQPYGISQRVSWDEISGTIGPYTLMPGQIAHIPFFAYVIEPGLPTTVLAEVLLDDEIPSNNISTTPLYSHDRHEVVHPKDGVIAIEAEWFNYQGFSTLAAQAQKGFQIPAWHLHSETTQTTKQPDPDGSSPLDAGNSAYIEALPDVRSVESQSSVFGISNFDEPTSGPNVAYTINVNHPGNYYLFARMRAKNSQDNTIHVRAWDARHVLRQYTISVCNPDGTWQWATTDDLYCGERGAYFDVGEPGLIFLNVFMQDDGAELDKLVLQRENDIPPSGIGPESSAHLNTCIRCFQYDYATWLRPESNVLINPESNVLINDDFSAAHADESIGGGAINLNALLFFLILIVISPFRQYSFLKSTS